MANKTQGTRQKLNFRIEPSNQPGGSVPGTSTRRPRNPLVPLARQRKAGAHRKDPATERQEQRRALEKTLRENDPETD
jgi:hypothetical protein